MERINPSDTDYGQCLDEARTIAIENTVRTIYYWSNMVACSGLICVFIMGILQRKQHLRNESATAEILVEYEHALALSNAQLEEARKKNYALMEASVTLRESLAHPQVPATETPDKGPAQQVRGRTGSTQSGPQALPSTKPTEREASASAARTTAAAESQIGLFSQDSNLVSRINSLEQQLTRAGETEKLLRRQLNEAGRKLQAEQERNRSLKGD